MRAFLIVTVIVLFGGVCFGVDRFVPDVYSTIQAGVDAAVGGDVVIVADGIYRGEGNRDIDFWGKAITVRSENGAATCTIDCEDTTQAFHRGFNFHSNETLESVVDGFTIINGYSDVGGGISCNPGSPTIKNCVIKDNSVFGSGGGMIVISGEPIVRNCVFEGNTAASAGGGMCNYMSDSAVINCIFKANVGTLKGGGVYNSNANGAAFIGCMFVGNLTGSEGGGMYNWVSRPSVINCTIATNRAGYLGGGDMQQWR